MASLSAVSLAVETSGREAPIEPGPLELLLLPNGISADGILFSILLHSALIALLPWLLPIMFPRERAMRPYSLAQMLRETDYQPIIFRGLPQFAGAGAGARPRAPIKRRSLNHSEAGTAHAARPLPDYIGPVVIVSNSPNATNRVQTIRRPELIAPPKLKFPVRLQTMVMLPTSTTPILLASHRALPKPARAAEILIAEAKVQKPALIVSTSRLSAPFTKAPTVYSVATPTVLTPQTQWQMNAKKMVVVMNAVSVPPTLSQTIPNAELEGNFTVMPSQLSGTQDARADAEGKPESASTAAGAGSSLHPSAEPVAASELGRVDGRGAAPTGTSGGGTGAEASLPGGKNIGTGQSVMEISILGGVPGPSGQGVITGPLPPRSYGITIISGGSNGGASRDLGVFNRSETVYTVNIPMKDLGGNPWSMQYAMADSAAPNNGLLIPPFALKKVAAVNPGAEAMIDLGPVFVAGIIDRQGKLQDLRAIRAQDPRSQTAVAALAQWEFQPAQLDGQPVASKVLFGVSLPERER